MNDLASALNIGIPVFLALIILEWVWSYYKGLTVIRVFDSVSSLSSGITNIVKDVLGIAVIIISYEWMYSYLAVYSIENKWWLFIVTFILLDFANYWSHRFEHKINLFWNRHIIHHSSEEFNLACALRQPISSIVGIFFFLYIPLAIVGVSPKVVAVLAPIHLFAQFWYHTRLIGKLGFLEYIIVTPSHHRVHHAINDEYIDKNYAPIFILWDRFFGTFQEELDEVPAVYGIKKPAKTWNPILINFQHIWQLMKDAYHTNLWKDKLRIWFMPTGWRPEDVKANFPVEIIEDPYAQIKYETEGSFLLKLWSIIQLLITAVAALWLFNNIANFNFSYILLGGLFIMISIFSYTSLMDRHQFSVLTELLKFFCGCIIIVLVGGWFGFGNPLFVSYLFLSLAAAFYFTFIDKKGIVKTYVRTAN